LRCSDCAFSQSSESIHTRFGRRRLVHHPHYSYRETDCAAFSKLLDDATTGCDVPASNASKAAVE